MDQIFVNNYVKEIEIGAFRSELGRTQRVEFNVWLDIEPPKYRLSDNVEKVLSYELIIEAINSALEKRRFNLLETLAEKIAARCLKEARVLRVQIKIEKLDRIPGSLGIFITRGPENYGSQTEKDG